MDHSGCRHTTIHPQQQRHSVRGSFSQTFPILLPLPLPATHEGQPRAQHSIPYHIIIALDTNTTLETRNTDRIEFPRPCMNLPAPGVQLEAETCLDGR